MKRVQSNTGLYDIISLLIPTVSGLFSGIFVIDYLVKKYSKNPPKCPDLLYGRPPNSGYLNDKNYLTNYQKEKQKIRKICHHKNFFLIIS